MAKFYSIKKILATNSEYNILLGERSNGKSYAVCEHVLKDYLEYGRKLVYVRRYKEEATTTAVESWFENLGTEKMLELTNGKYDCVVAWQQKIYLAKTDENYRKVKGEIIGRYCALNRSSQLKSTFQDPAFFHIIYEEFITDDIYLYNEPNRLQSFVSTVLRKRDGRVWLIGNTISQVCPYYSDWELFNVTEQKHDTIDLYKKKITGDDGSVQDLQIAVELCPNSSVSSSMVFGHIAKQINGQSWSGKEYPKSNTLGKGFEQCYTLFIHTVQFDFLMSLLVNENDGNMVLQVTNAYKKPTETNRVITNLVTKNRRWTPSLNDTRIEKLIGRLWKDRKIFYKNDLIGQNFEQCEKILKRGE